MGSTNPINLVEVLSNVLVFFLLNDKGYETHHISPSSKTAIAA